jgi:hypothetical protein
MPRRSLVVVVAALALLTSGRVGVAGTAESDGENIRAVAETSGSENVSSGSPARGPRCSWTVSAADLLVDGVPVNNQAGRRPLYRSAGSGRGVERVGEGVEVLYEVRCPYGIGPVQYRYAVPADYVDRQALIRGAYDEAVSRIPVPSIDMAPAPEHGGVVNLGIWMAISDPGQVNAFASVGPVWASVTARYVSMRWEMGNGDVVECDGLGVPYTGGPSDDYGEGPCGYTYTHSGNYQIRVVGHWEIDVVTSDGVNETLEPANRPFEFDYQVVELITVGHP